MELAMFCARCFCGKVSPVQRSLRGSVDNLMRTGLGDDPWLDWDNSVGGYWPRLRDSTPIRSTVRAR